MLNALRKDCANLFIQGNGMKIATRARLLIQCEATEKIIRNIVDVIRIEGYRLRMDHIKHAIYYVRACGPVTLNEIARELRIQCKGANSENSTHLAQTAVNHGLETGWLEKYDDESFWIKH